MKLTLKIKLLPTDMQAKALRDTIRTANSCCNAISTAAWEQKVFNRFKLHHGSWSFHQLRAFVEYKAALGGVKCVVVDPAYTSQTCSCCHHIGKRSNKSFQCMNCGHNEDADVNATRNMALLGASVNMPEKQGMWYSCAVHYLCLKPTDL